MAPREEHADAVPIHANCGKWVFFWTVCAEIPWQLKADQGRGPGASGLVWCLAEEGHGPASLVQWRQMVGGRVEMAGWVPSSWLLYKQEDCASLLLRFMLQFAPLGATERAKEEMRVQASCSWGRAAVLPALTLLW